MKKILLLLLLIGYMVCSSTAQRQMSERQKRTQEAKVAGGELLEKYKAGLLTELKGNDEQIYHEVAQAFYELGMEKTMDSIWTVVRKKFPRGTYARNTSVNTIYNEKDPVKKEKLYQHGQSRVFLPAPGGGHLFIRDRGTCVLFLLYQPVQMERYRRETVCWLI